jgi:hypothetical protein
MAGGSLVQTLPSAWDSSNARDFARFRQQRALNDAFFLFFQEPIDARQNGLEAVTRAVHSAHP